MNETIGGNEGEQGYKEHSLSYEEGERGTERYKLDNDGGRNRAVRSGGIYIGRDRKTELEEEEEEEAGAEKEG